ncbi:MAG: hypothetical protein R2851_23460 [Caldilineaceae bacterium]
MRDATAPTLDDDLLRTFAPDQVSPALALRELAGDPANALAFQAANAGDLATAHALALFDTTTTGAPRAGFWSLLGRAYTAADRPQDAANVARMAAPLATLDASISVRERHQLLVQAAQSYLDAGFTAAAADAAQQAFILASRAPELLPVQRAELFTALEPLAAALDDPAFTAQVRELARNPFLETPGVIPAPILADAIEAPVPDPAVDAAIAARRQAAHGLADRILFTGGVDVEPELQALTDALRAGRRGAQSVLQRTGAGGPRRRPCWVAPDALPVAGDQLRIALGGYGVSPDPRVGGQCRAIRKELSDLTTKMDAEFRTVGQSGRVCAGRAGRAKSVSTGWRCSGDLGLYPGAQPATLGQRIRRDQDAYASFGTPLALPVGYEAGATPPGFRFLR